MIPFARFAQIGRPQTGGGGGGFTGTITIAAGEVGSNLTNYPVYLNLADLPSGFWSAVSSDGGNIRIKQSGSVIPFDVVKIDTGTNTGTLFFLVSTLLSGSDNVFTIDLTGSGLIATGDPNGRDDVWAAYDWVWIPSATDDFTDRTGTSDGTKQGGTETLAFSAVALGAGCGLDWPGNATGTRIDFASRTSRTVFSMGGTGLLDIATAIDRWMLSYRNAASGATDNHIRLGVEQFNSPDYWTNWDDLNLHNAGSRVAHSASVARRLDIIYDGTTERKLYIDGAIIATDTTISVHSTLDTITVGIEDTSEAGYWNGQISYCYLRPEILTADFFAAVFSNVNAPSSFYAIT